MMSALAVIGNRIEVTPWDEIWVVSGKGRCVYVADDSAFVFRVDGTLMDGVVIYGLYGAVVSGHGRYEGLVCNILVRADSYDWDVVGDSQAAFKVGRGVVARNSEFDFRHPEGTRMEGYPVIGRFGRVRVLI
ncbi:MAG: hypothetical protein ACSHX6_06795 [Akkermansiaceae bacterium]